MRTSDLLESDRVLTERGELGLQIAAQQSHQEIGFAARTLLPVLFRKGIERERRNADARRRFYRRPYRRHSGPVSGNARQMAAARPASVAVHDDGDVLWEPCRIEPMINVRLFAIQPGRNCRLQALTSAVS